MELRCARQWRVSILFVVLGAGLLVPVLVQAALTARIGEVWLADEAHAAPFHEAFAEGSSRAWLRGGEESEPVHALRER